MSRSCARTEELLDRVRRGGSTALDRGHLENCPRCHEAVAIEALLLAEKSSSLEESREALPTPETTLHRLVRRERRERERRAFLLLRAVQGFALTAAVVSAWLVLRWLAPGLVPGLVNALGSASVGGVIIGAAEPGQAASALPGEALWAYLLAGGLLVVVLGYFRGWLGGEIEGEE